MNWVDCIYMMYMLTIAVLIKDELRWRKNRDVRRIRSKS